MLIEKTIEKLHPPIIKNAFIAIALHIEFQALKFDTEFIRAVFDDNFAEIRLACARAEAGELRAAYSNGVISLRSRVIE